MPQTKKSSSAPKKKAGPIAVSCKSGATKPSYLSSSKPSSIRVKRTEFVGSVTNGATTGFALTQVSLSTPGYDFNPACTLLFPWLSTIAESFERFKFHNLSFRLIPSQATTTAGRIYAAIDYDYDDALPTNKVGLMSNLSVQESPVWDEVRLSCDPRQLHPDMPFKYVSSYSRANYVEPRTAFSGFLMIAYDTPTANLLYDLEVSYDVELSIPVMDGAGLVDTFSSAAIVTDSSTFPSIPAGTKFAGELLPKMVLPTGTPLKTVTPGNLGIPQMMLQTTTPQLAQLAFDLQACPRTRGSLTSIWEATRAGTPATSITTNDESVHHGVYDALGAWLGYVPFMSAVSNKYGSAQGASLAEGSTWAGAGGAYAVFQKVALAGLFQMYPTARYLVPVVISAAGSATSSRKAGLQLEL